MTTPTQPASAQFAVTINFSACAFVIRALPVLVINRVFTRDIKVACCDGGWQSIAVPPSPDAGWAIFDITTRDRRTGWRRFHIKWVAP